MSNLENIKNIDFGITNIKTTSPIYVTFSGHVTSNETNNLTFRANILVNNGDILHSIDKNIDLNSQFNFDITIDIMKEILN